MMPPIEAWIILGIILMPWIVPILVWYIIGYILKIKKGDSWRVKDFISPFPDELMGVEIGAECATLPATNLILLFVVIYRCLRPYVCEKLEYCGRGFNRLLNYEVIKGEDKKESKTGESKKPGLWVARDENGTLCLYLGKPKKNEFLWEGTESTMGIYSDCLPDHCNPLWIDDEPIEVKLVKA